MALGDGGTICSHCTRYDGFASKDKEVMSVEIVGEGKRHLKIKKN
jgi:hypothetical protein